MPVAGLRIWPMAALPSGDRKTCQEGQGPGMCGWMGRRWAEGGGSIEQKECRSSRSHNAAAFSSQHAWIRLTQDARQDQEGHRHLLLLPDASRAQSLMPVLQQTPARQGDVHAACLRSLDTTPNGFLPLTTHTLMCRVSTPYSCASRSSMASTLPRALLLACTCDTHEGRQDEGGSTGRTAALKWASAAPRWTTD